MASDSAKAQNDALAAWKNRKKKAAGNSIEVLPLGQKAPLSYGQQRLWLLDQLYPEQPLYHYAHLYKISGKLDTELFEKSFLRLAERHAVLRSNYVTEGESQFQFNQDRPLSIQHFDYTELAEEKRAEIVSSRIKELSAAPFDLAKDCLLRLYFFKCAEDYYRVLVVMHHIIGDAWSMDIINRELAELYQSERAGREPRLEPLKFQYKDYAEWQRKQTIKQSDLDFWQQELSGELPVLDLPKKATGATRRGKTLKLMLPEEVRQQLIELAREHDTTMFVLTMAIYKLLLSHYSLQNEVIVGSPFSNRDTPDLEKLIGFFNETLVVKTAPDQGQLFTNYLAKVKQATLEAFSHKGVPFDQLVALSGVDRNTNENPLFQTMFLYNGEGQGLELGPDLRVEEEMLDLGVAKFDLTLFVNEKSEGLELALEYTLELETVFVEQMLESLETLIYQVLQNPASTLSSLSIFNEEQLRRIEGLWHGESIPSPDWKSVHQCIVDQVKTSPQNPAVIWDDHFLTYEKLNKWSDHLALKLIEEGVGRNDFVGLYTGRCLEMIVGILGILKAGAAYLPLDPEYPASRLNFMLHDTRAKVILSGPGQNCQLDLNGRKLLPIEEDYEHAAQASPLKHVTEPEDYAYVIYTSGSTGNPKGVPVSHANLLHSTLARFTFFEQPMERFLLLSSFSFDSSVAGIFWSLCSAGTLVLPPLRIEQDIEALARIIHNEKITHSLMLPSLYQMLLRYAPVDKLFTLKAIMVAGEACPVALKDLHFERLPEVRLYNEYGPTEATVWCVAHEIKRGDSRIPIGKPIANTSALILDEQMNPVPIGVAGQLYIGGPGVTGGYLNNLELSSQKFVADPFSGEGKFYKTGDLARFASDGLIDFLGRADAQVKIRGFRVELEEIRNRILETPQVAEAVVRIREDRQGNKQLVAWLESEAKGVDQLVSRSLRKSLPAYMVPSHFETLSELPRLPNGKVDQKKVYQLALSERTRQSEALPVTEKEKKLAEIWQRVLKLEVLGVEDNFFDIGGDSILSIQIVAQARQAGMLLKPTAIFEQQTIRSLAKEAELLELEKTTETNNETFPIRVPLSYQQQAFLFHSLQSKQDQGFLQLEFQIEGEIDPGQMQLAWQFCIKTHPVLRTSFHWRESETPYQLIHETMEEDWHFQDFSVLDQSAQMEQVQRFRLEDERKGLDLNKPAGGRLTLLKLAESKFLLHWTTHHILIDGWSGAIIVKDLLSSYHCLVSGDSAEISPVPDIRKYLGWKEQQPEEAAKAFFSNMLSGINPSAVSGTHGRKAKPQFEDLSTRLGMSTVEQLKKLAKKHRLTMGTLLQGAWMLTLRSFLGGEDAVLGVTVTGRSAGFDGVDRYTGLLMNVLPVAQKTEGGAVLEKWFIELQQSLNEIRQFEHIDLNRIEDWVGATPGKALFDSLFVYGNFMNESITIGDLKLGRFTGDFSAIFPLTLRVNPVDDYEVNCRFDVGMLSTEIANWLINSYITLLQQMAGDGLMKKLVADIQLPAPPEDIEKPRMISEDQTDNEERFGASVNKTQLELLKIWERVIGRELIDIHDNYFEIGGTSLGALRLFAEIEKQFGKKLSPVSIIEHPSIAQLSKLLADDEQEGDLSSIIPMKTSGNQSPLFCLHSGGAYVLFYQGLARYMAADRPVYAIQPTGLSGHEEHHETIAEMAAHYISEMRKIQPVGPYHLLGTCFGNAVGIEMAHQLQQTGEKLAVLYVVDSAPAYLEPPSPNGEKKPVSRMFKMIADGNWSGIVKKFRNRYIRLDKKLKAGQRTEQEAELDEIIDSLNDLYVKYSWKPVSDKVVLIRSSQFSQRKDKQFHLDRWNHLAQSGLEVLEAEGHHLTLFDEPEVQGLTHLIGEHLASLTEN